MLYLVPPLCTTRLNANDFKECYLCNTQGRLYEESYSLLTGHWFFLKVFCTLIIHGLKGNFPSSLPFSCILLHISTMVSVLHPQSELSCSPIYSFSTVNSLCDKHIYILNWWLHSAPYTYKYSFLLNQWELLCSMTAGLVWPRIIRIFTNYACIKE